MRRSILIILGVLSLTSTASLAGDHHHANDHAAHEAAAHGIHGLHAWTRATDDDHALVFVELKNESDHEVHLTGGHSAIAETVTLVGFQMQEGEAVYVPIPQVPVQPEGELDLMPNGLALQLDGLARPLAKGESFEVEIVFDQGHLMMPVQVEAYNATQHSHAGHMH
ncbi:copper chaperone PCu(A)C [Pseudovibrio exalbescens]|uniref:copper chaperone PCu(A)C n=1 Tax=Pseudovibrio exalbescens TaxID=197461 RepID=UPI000C9A35A2|nr:copper chaperone PCu(A)C [Pseudovibrio exalbescens]